MKRSRISKNKIANFIIENCNTQSPSTADKYTLWEHNGELKITRGSMRYRDEDIVELFGFALYNEVAPYSKRAIKTMVNALYEEFE
jgi:hypothetical protein